MVERCPGAWAEHEGETPAEAVADPIAAGHESPPKLCRVAPPARLAGEAPAVRRLRGQLEAAAAGASSVLLTGETGSGKGLAAQMLHDSSPRRREPFVRVDCAALSASVIESELFGHERGAFTGAVERRIGRFERAGAGTVFLDEIGELSPRLQSKLLGVLQDRCFERVGGSRTLINRARVVAATNRDLSSEIATGRFRADLYYRLQVFEIRVPPLRERIDDLPLLTGEVLELLSRRLGIAAPTLSEGAQSVLRAHSWPGNVRELWNVLERLLQSCSRWAWEADDVQRVLSVGERHAGLPVETKAEFDERERSRIAAALASNRWNVSAAARSLGLSRGALRGRMARLGIR